jgi:rubrerythrin
MFDKLTELLDIALDREIASQAFYIAGQKMTQDPGAIELMRELADQELRHYQWIKDLKENGLNEKSWDPERLPGLMISEYLTDTRFSEGAGLQEVITVAIKREQYSVEFYTGLNEAMKGEDARQLCGKLINEELRHKTKLEKFYDDLFNKEN